ncbi:chromodomain-helicase-DNA-binding protein 1-like isoform X2 [Protopterus annectens]|nr:chromodomain-helicase-DNA-binding protein 1-like isoform X2 [Protopterus annectens]
MGLGKTCQTISLLLVLTGHLKKNDPFLILCPLSVLSNWEEELQRFAPRLSVLVLKGDKETRHTLLQDISERRPFHVLLTTYEICLKEASFLRRLTWNLLVVDEAHRLKNSQSLLHKTLSMFSASFTLLLTGTPVQNNLQELYSLLTFIEPDIFPLDDMKEFEDYYLGVEKQTEKVSELHNLLQPFLLRRVKADVASELPKKVEVVLYHGMSALQKHYYKAILMKDPSAFESVESGKKASLLNVLIQLRKCVNHPYLFDGVEPEPFEIGEHLVEASGKLHLLDKLLAFLHARGHRVLLFSQMTLMLDILQDYMEYRDYSYERLDGSVRGEERHLAIKNFNQQDIFVFLLSTRAGGVGMNLTAADTVVFFDSDFNPQNDLQAAARAHRIGQKRPVKVIRLVGRDTVEEIIYRRAVSKLKLTNAVIEAGQFRLSEDTSKGNTDIQLSEILKFGLDELLSTEESTIRDIDLEKVLGATRKGEWVTDDYPVQMDQEEDEEEEEPEEECHMYIYEGKDYSKEASTSDQAAFEKMLDLRKALLEETCEKGRALRNKTNVVMTMPLQSATRKKRVLTPEELEERHRKRQEAAAKRAKLMEEKRKEKEEAEYKKKLSWWESCGYRSFAISSEDSESEEELEYGALELDVDSTGAESTSINYVMGDVTHPKAAKGDAIIVHCVDDSGYWGRGGLFTALAVRSDESKKHYELAGKMEDLSLGRVLLFPIDDKESRSEGSDLLALIVAQHRDRSNSLSGIKLTALEEGLKKIYFAAKKRNASVHLPRIGHATKNFNWYGTERLIRKYLAARKIPTYIYYFPRSLVHSGGPQPSVPSSTGLQSKEKHTKKVDKKESTTAGLPDFLSTVTVFFYNITEAEKKKLTRYLITYDGNVSTKFSAECTHIVTEVESPQHAQELQRILKENSLAVIVQPRWLETCFSKQRKVDIAKYEIDLNKYL